MRNKHYTNEDYKLVMRLHNKGMSPKQIIKYCKYTYDINLTKAIEHWIYDGTKPFSAKFPLKESMLSIQKAYILGVLCGDGCADFKKPRVVLQTVSKEFLDEWIRAFKKHYDRTANIREISKEKISSSYIKSEKRFIVAKKGQYSATYYGRELLLDLCQENDFKTHTWRIPKEIMENDDGSIISYFLKGLYDSDGYAGHHVNLSSGSKKGLEDTRDLLMKIGVDEFSTHITKTHTCFVLSIHNQKGKRTFQKYVNFSILFRKEKLAENLSKYKSKKSYSVNRVKKLIPDILTLKNKEKLSSRKIAKRLGISKTAVLRCLNNHNSNALLR